MNVSLDGFVETPEHSIDWAKADDALAALKGVGLPYSRAAIQEILRSGRLPPA